MLSDLSLTVSKTCWQQNRISTQIAILKTHTIKKVKKHSTPIGGGASDRRRSRRAAPKTQIHIYSTKLVLQITHHETRPDAGVPI